MTKADWKTCELIGEAIGRHILQSEKNMALALALRDQRQLLVDIYDALKASGNCVFCLADLVDRVTPGAKPSQKRRHGHPKNCLWLRLHKEIHDA